MDKKSLETVFLIAICRQSGDKWQSKTMFLAIFDLRSSIVLSFSIATYQCEISQYIRTVSLTRALV